MLNEKAKNIEMLQTAIKCGGTQKRGLNKNFKTHALQHVEMMV